MYFLKWITHCFQINIEISRKSTLKFVWECRNTFKNFKKTIGVLGSTSKVFQMNLPLEILKDFPLGKNEFPLKISKEFPQEILNESPPGNFN